MRTILLTTSLMLIAIMPVAFAADEPSTTSTSASASPAQGVDIRALIESVSDRTHKKFLVDPRILGTVGLNGVAPREVTYPLLLTVLAVHGYATYEQEGVVVVAPDANERFFPTSMVKADDIRAPDAEVVTTIVVVKTAKAAELVTVLRPFVPTTGQINAFPDRNAILMTDRAANIRRIVSMIRELDRLPAIKTE